MQTTCPLCGRPLDARGSMALRGGRVSLFECGRCRVSPRIPTAKPLPFMFAVDAHGTIYRPDQDPDAFA